MSAALIHLVCPACGQAFLTRVQHPQSVQSCPHCAFTGVAGQFSSTGSTAAGIDFQKRKPVRRPQTAPMAALNPNAWEVRVYDPIVPAPLPAQPTAYAVPPSSTRYQPAPEPPPWETMQAFATAASFPGGPAAVPVSTPPPVEPVPAQRMAPWSPMKPSSTPKLTPWTSLDIASTPGDPTYFVPKPKRNFTALFIILTTIVLTGFVAALWLDKENAKRAIGWLRDSAPDQQTVAKPQAPTILPAIVKEPEAPPLPPESQLSSEETMARVGALLNDFTHATTTGARLACLAVDTRQRDNVEDFFKKIPGVLDIKVARALPAPVQVLPGKYPITLCTVDAVMPEGKVTGLARLTHATDGSTRLDWSSLHDSLQRKLSHYSQAQKTDPEWITIGILRNFGFDEPADIRERHLVFDIQGLGDGTDHLVALVSKETPLGRALDETLAWKQLYLMRALVHWTTVGDKPRLTLLDAELAPDTVSMR